MGLFWASTPSSASAAAAVASANSYNSPPPACPMHNKDLQAACPVKKTGSSSGDEALNPLTNMPYDLSTKKQPGQKIDLPTERTLSTIPRGEDHGQGVWEYPSPQQMLNAMLRKGKGDVPEDAVESMVNIHNFLNEGAWEEIEQWEEPYTEQTHVQPRLLKFTGRPDAVSPRARYYNFMSYFFPDKYGTELPFDRHDWTVLRSDGAGNWKEVRYVIDYYSGGEDQFGFPAFYLDVRPGLDNVDNAVQRFNHWRKIMRPTWEKAMGHSPETGSKLASTTEKK